MNGSAVYETEKDDKVISGALPLELHIEEHSTEVDFRNA